VEKIGSLSEVTKKEPFLSGDRKMVFFDLDGVLCEYGRKNNSDDNISRLLAIRDILSQTDEVIYNSLRFNIDENGNLWKLLKPIFGRESISHCPFITESSENKLEHFSKMANSEIKVRFNIGSSKIKNWINPDENILSWSEEALEQGKKIIIIGSSPIDLKIAEHVADNASEKGLNNQNVYSFNTGHRLI